MTKIVQRAGSLYVGKNELLTQKKCQKFILKKTSNLNASQCTKFWKELNRMFSKKRDNKVDFILLILLADPGK